jgi:hemerythrin-like domain-containing protein
VHVVGKQLLDTESRPDTHDMVVIHRIFRRGFPELSALVGDAPRGELARANAIANHVDFLLNGLEPHHRADDDHLWPRLLDRVIDQRDEIERMAAAHHEIAELSNRARQVLPLWRQSGEGTELAQVLQRLGAALVEHLDEEEATMLPLVQAHLSSAEWQQLGEAAFENFTNAEKLVATGQMVDVATPEEAAMFMGKLPAPIRLMWRVVGHRRYERYIRSVRGAR